MEENDNQQLNFTEKEQIVIKELCNNTEKYIFSYELLQNTLDNGRYIAFAQSNRDLIGGTSKDRRYYYIAICKQCRTIRKFYKSDFKKNTTCRQCNIINNHNNFKGTYGTYKVIKFDKVDKLRKLYYICECTKCNKQMSVRKEIILNNTDSGCIYCKGNGVKITRDAPMNAMEYSYKQGALTRGLNWNLSQEEFRKLISGNCYYCDCPPSEFQSLKRYNKTDEAVYTNGIDRLDSSQGYSLNNCVSCCPMCNRMKSNFNIEDFLNKIFEIYKKFSSTTIENTSNDESE